MRLYIGVLLPFTVAISSATVVLNKGVDVCRGTLAVVTCTTVTGTGFLLWRNISGIVLYFDEFSIIGDKGTLGSINITLTNMQPVSNAVVYTSEAMVKDNLAENKIIFCSDGDIPQSIDIQIKNPSNPSWAHSPCRFSEGRVQLTWNAPSVAPECCDRYTVQLSTGSVFISYQTSITIPIETEQLNVTVYCVDHVGEMTSKSVDLSIDIAINIEHITIGRSADDNVTYQIVWGTKSSSGQNRCTPPITKSTIICTTQSRRQSSVDSSFMNCSVPSNETVDVTVIIANAAGVTEQKSTSADSLDLTCQRLMGAEYSLSTGGISAIFIAYFLTVPMVIACTLITINRFRKKFNGRIYYPNRKQK